MFISHNIRRKAGYLVLLMMVFFSGFLLGQEVTVSARLDSSGALIGDQLTLHLRVEKSSGASVSFPNYADTLAGKIEISPQVRQYPPPPDRMESWFSARTCLLLFLIRVWLKYPHNRLFSKRLQLKIHSILSQLLYKSVLFLWIQPSGISRPI